MTYFVEMYENDLHVGTRTLRAVTEGEAAMEVCAILRATPSNGSDFSARLFEQPPLSNYREVAGYQLLYGAR